MSDTKIVDTKFKQALTLSAFLSNLTVTNVKRMDNFPRKFWFQWDQREQTIITEIMGFTGCSNKESATLINYIVMI